MAKHLYLAVTCNTPGCTSAGLIKYLGLQTGQTTIGDSVPVWFEYECGECHRLHHYEREDVYPVITDTAPPLGFENQF